MLARLGGRTFASLRHRDYRLYFAGNAVSFVGTWMQQIAAYWLVLDLTGSPLAVGALALVQTLPVTAFALVGGAVADRVDLRRMVITCESVLAAVALTPRRARSHGHDRRLAALRASASCRASRSRSTRPRATRSCSGSSAEATWRTPLR